MSNFVGKINLSGLIDTQIMDVEMNGFVEKGIFIPFKPNGIVQWQNEFQLWFRSISYRQPQTKFTHFIMKFVPRSTIKKLSASQIEKFANNSIGGMIKVINKNEPDNCDEKLNTNDFISQNI